VTTADSFPEHSRSESIVEMGRVGGLSDAVYAVAMTLLVLDIRLPEDTLVGDVPSNLLQLAPKLLVYLIGFIIIGGAWGSHQRMLHQIRRGDGLLVWFNLFSLLFVTLLPASAVLLGRFPDSFLAIACFAADVILIQLAAWLLWRHASRHHLIDPGLDPRVVTGIGRRLGLSALTFGLYSTRSRYMASGSGSSSCSLRPIGYPGNRRSEPTRQPSPSKAPRARGFAWCMAQAT
jgi:uncharacterized membrane protein